jgi:hypothetical protein
MDKDLVIGIAAGYNFEKIETFVKSLIKTGYQGDLAIVAGDNMVIPQWCRDKLNIILIKEPNFGRTFLQVNFRRVMYHFFRKWSCTRLAGILKSIKNKSQDKFLNAFISTYHVQTGRYAFYYKFLKANKQYRNVMFSDIRDVYFQDEPFEQLKAKFSVFQESSNYFIKQDQAINAKWIKMGFGNEEYEKIKENVIYCSGTIIGQYASIMSFLDLFLNTCLQYKVPYYEKGIDQGVFNFLVHNNLIPDMYKSINGEHILTIGTEPLSDITYHGDKINFRGAQPSVVHQYDRHAELISFINNQLTDLS